MTDSKQPIREIKALLQNVTQLDDSNLAFTKMMNELVSKS